MRTVQELMNLKNRVAIITGGAGYLGSAICESFAEAGADLVIIDLERNSCENKAKHLEDSYNLRAIPLCMDLGNEAALKKIPDIVLEEFGRIDILVNCAALVGTSTLTGWSVPFPEQSPDTWRTALEINLTVPFILSQTCTPALRESGHGSIINIGSIYGVNGPDMALYEATGMGNPAAYAASKGGLIQLTRWLATVLAPNIRVNALTPGGIARNQPEIFTERYIRRTPLQRMAVEEDFKGAALYLASDLSSYVTGQNLIVDGGWTVW
jgi:NAD(P)-dependent dehydrogenase (short-subunit alcohol dehydrogenase family)